MGRYVGECVCVAVSWLQKGKINMMNGRDGGVCR